MQRLRDFFARFHWRTLTTAAATILLGIADIFQVIDLHSLVSLFVQEARVGQVVAVLGLLFGLLRLVTTNAVLAPKEDEE